MRRLIELWKAAAEPAPRNEPLPFDRNSRPPRDEWKALDNVGDGDEVAAYEEAARTLGVDIKVSYPIPAHVGADYCASLGMKGIYIRRCHAERGSALTREKDAALKRMLE